MRKKTTITKIKKRNETLWQVRGHEDDKVYRKFFSSQAGAEAFVAEKNRESLTARKRLAALPNEDQEQLMMIHTEAQTRSIPLVSILTMMDGAKVEAPKSPTLQKVADELEVLKRQAGRAGKYLDHLTQIITGFSKNRTEVPIDRFTVQDIEAYMGTKSIHYRTTIRSRLSTLFEFAVRRRYRKDNPCAQLEAITAPKKKIEVLTVEETKKCLDWLKVNPRSMAWFVLSTFCGLRPEEAEKTGWHEINFKESWVKVEAQTTKVRQRRIVYPLPNAMAWLEKAKKLGSKLPLTIKTRKADRHELRDVLKWKVWKQDVTRHTASSMWLAHTGDAATVATACGHSEAVMKRDYMALVTKVEAEKFWKL